MQSRQQKRRKVNKLKPILLDYVRVTDPRHKQFNRVGQLTDYDTWYKEYIIHFDKIDVAGHIHWTGESSRVKLNQVEKAFKFDLDKMA